MKDISLSNITVRLGKINALVNVSFKIYSGEIFGLVGRNGSGKTTILKAICGLVKPDEGKILIDDEQADVNGQDFKRMIGYCPQENCFFEKLSVRENMEYFAYLYNVGSNVGSLIAGISKSLCLDDKLGELAANLSGGMKRRLNIACALVHEPQVLLMDEPSIELDPLSRDELWRMIRLINRSGTTIIISSNHMEEIRYLCTNAVYLEDGKKIYEGEVNDVISLIYSKGSQNIGWR